MRFTYRDKEGRNSSRSVDPYGFVINAGRVYCVAFDHKRKDKRTFAVDSVSEPKVLGKTFVRPADFSIEAYAGASISGVLHNDETTAVRVHFEPRVAKAATAARIVAEPAHRAAARRRGGHRLRVADVDEMVRWVLGWGAQAEIVEPASARQRIAALANEVTSKYRG